jgi:iron complex transport system permease protein
MISIVLNLSPSPFAVMEIIFWMMGSLADKPLAQVLALLPVMLAGMIVMLLAARALDAMALGRETAMSLGISLPWLQFALVSGMALSVGAATALSGMIGFVGLVVPHLLRQLFRLKPSALLLPSALGGGLLLLLADSLARIIPTSGTELRIGVVTALIGAPFFLWLLLRYRREGSL